MADDNAGTADQTVQAADWYTKVQDPETRGYFENRGLHVKPIEEALFETAKAHREASKFLGVPPEQLLRMPKADAPEAEVDAFRSRLGIPKDPKDYDFSAIKKADGTPLDQAFQDSVRDLAATLQLPKERAPELAARLLKAQQDVQTERAATDTAALEQSRARLKENWGENFAANEVVAKAAAKALLESAGMKAEEITQATAALEKVVGYDRTMELFRAIGMKIGEGRFISNQNPLNGGVMTKDAAVERIAELKADTKFVDRYLNGDTAANREMAALHAIVAG